MSAFELHNGRKPNTEITNMRNGYISAKPDTIQVYSFSGDGGQSDFLPMEPQRKSAKLVSNYPFYFLEKKINKNKFESPYQENL